MAFRSRFLKEAGQAFYHVTEREYADDIVNNGFMGGWGDVGFGVYFYGTPYSAIDYAKENGWDGSLADPVIIGVKDPKIQKISGFDLHPSWDPEKYADMFWYSMDEEDEERRWRPQEIRILP